MPPRNKKKIDLTIRLSATDSGMRQRQKRKPHGRLKAALEESVAFQSQQRRRKTEVETAELTTVKVYFIPKTIFGLYGGA